MLIPLLLTETTLLLMYTSVDNQFRNPLQNSAMNL